MKYSIVVLSFITSVLAGMYDPNLTSGQAPMKEPVQASEKSDSPASAVPENEKAAENGSSFSFGDLFASAFGDNSVSVGATDEGAGGSANGLNGALAAAQASPAAPSAFGLSF